MSNFCLCGCKTELPIERKYVHGHNFNSKFAQYARSKSTGHLGHKHIGDLSRFGKHRIGVTPTNAIKKQERRGIKTEFKKGHAPWNKNTKGIMKAWNKGTENISSYPEEWRETFKEGIRQRDNYTCQKCGKLQSELTGFHKKLVVHHIDYDKSNLNPENLITLCRNCHVKTNTNREYWTNYFNNK
jgi:hypothetical protein